MEKTKGSRLHSLNKGVASSFLTYSEE